MSKLSLNADLVGRRYPEMRNYLSKAWVNAFKGSTSSAKPMPLSFVAALRDGPFAVFDDLEVPLKNLLHISQDYDYHAPLEIEKDLRHLTKILKLKEKTIKLGDVYLMVLETDFLQDDELKIQSRMSVFIRR